MVLEAEQLLEMVESLPENQQNVFNHDAQIVKLKEEIERNKNFKLKLYENLQEGKGIHVIFRYHDNWDKLIAAISNIPADMKSQMAV